MKENNSWKSKALSFLLVAALILPSTAPGISSYAESKRETAVVATNNQEKRDGVLTEEKKNSENGEVKKATEPTEEEKRAEQIDVLRRQIKAVTAPGSNEWNLIRELEEKSEIDNTAEDVSNEVYRFVNGQKVKNQEKAFDNIRNSIKTLDLTKEEKEALKDELSAFAKIDVIFNITLGKGYLNAQRKIRVNHPEDENYVITFELLTKKGETTGFSLTKKKHDKDVVADKNSKIAGFPRTECIANGAAISYINRELVPKISDYFDYYLVDGEKVTSVSSIKNKISKGGFKAGDMRGQHIIAAVFKEEYGGEILSYNTRTVLNLPNEKKCILEDDGKELKDIQGYEKVKEFDNVKTALNTAVSEIEVAETLNDVDIARTKFAVTVNEAVEAKEFEDKKIETTKKLETEVDYYDAFENDESVKAAKAEAAAKIAEAKTEEELKKAEKEGKEAVEKAIKQETVKCQETVNKETKETLENFAKAENFKDNFYSKPVFDDENSTAKFVVVEDGKIEDVFGPSGEKLKNLFGADERFENAKTIKVYYEDTLLWTLKGQSASRRMRRYAEQKPENLSDLNGKQLTIVAEGPRLGLGTKYNMAFQVENVEQNRKDLVNAGKKAANYVVKEGSIESYFFDTVDYDDKVNTAKVTILKDANIASLAGEKGTGIWVGLEEGIKLGTIENLKVSYNNEVLFEIKDIQTTEPNTDVISIDGLPERLKDLNDGKFVIEGTGERLGKEPVTYTVNFKCEDINKNRSTLVETGKEAANKVVKEGSLKDYFYSNIDYADESCEVAILKDAKISDLYSTKGTEIYSGLLSGVKLRTMETLTVKYGDKTLFKLEGLLTSNPETTDINIDGLPERLKDLDRNKLHIIAEGQKLGEIPVEYTVDFVYEDIKKNQNDLVETALEGANKAVSEGTLSEYFSNTIEVDNKKNAAEVVILKDAPTNTLLSAQGTFIMEAIRNCLELGTLETLEVKYDGENCFTLEDLLTSEPEVTDIKMDALPEPLKDMDGKKLTFIGKGEKLGKGVSYEVTFRYEDVEANRKALIETGKRAANKVVKEGSLKDYFYSNIDYADESCEVAILKDAKISDLYRKEGTEIYSGLLSGVKLRTMETLTVKYGDKTLFKLEGLLTSNPETTDINIDGLPETLKDLDGKALEIIASGEKLGEKPVSYTVNFKCEDVNENRQNLINTGKKAANKVVKEGSLKDYFYSNIDYVDESCEVAILKDAKISDLYRKEGTEIYSGLLSGVKLRTMETLTVKYGDKTLFKLEGLLTSNPETTDINIDGLPETLKDLDGKALEIIASGEKLGEKPVSYTVNFKYEDVNENRQNLIEAGKNGANAVVSEGSLKSYFDDAVTYTENTATVKIIKDGKITTLATQEGTKIFESLREGALLGTMESIKVICNDTVCLEIVDLLTENPDTTILNIDGLPEELKDLDGKTFKIIANGEKLGGDLEYTVIFKYDLKGAKKDANGSVTKDIEHYDSYKDNETVKFVVGEVQKAINNANSIEAVEATKTEGAKKIKNAVELEHEKTVAKKEVAEYRNDETFGEAETESLSLMKDYGKKLLESATSKEQVKKTSRLTKAAIDSLKSEEQKAVEAAKDEKIKELNETLDEAQKAKKEFQENLDAANGKLKEVEENVKDLEEQLSGSKTANANLKKELEAAKKELEKAKTEITETKKSLETANKNIEKLESSKKTLEEQLSDVNSELAASDKRNEALENEKKNLEAELTKVNGNLLKTKKELDAANNKIAEANKTIDAAKKTINDLNGKVSDLEADNAKKDETITGLNNKINGLNEEVNTLNGKVSELEKTGKVKDTEIESLKGQVNTLEAKSERISKQLKEEKNLRAEDKQKAEKQIADLSKDIEKLNAAIANLEKEYNAVIEKVRSAKRKEINGLTIKADGMTANSVKAANKKLNELKTQAEKKSLTAKTIDEIMAVNVNVKDAETLLVKKTNYKNGVTKINGTWYYVEDGQIMYGYNGVEENQYGWWKITNGKVDFDFNGYAENRHGIWNIKNGKVDFNANGILKDYNTGNWYYTKGGKVQKSANTVAKNQYGWWHIKNGKVDFNSNAVTNNQYGWWKIRNGKVDFSFNGYAKNEYGTWNIKNGKVDFGAFGVIKDKVTGNWYNTRGGKVQAAETVAKNQYGWWYIDKTGKVDFNYNGLATNGYGTWYIRNGKVDFSFTGEYEISEGKKVNIVGGKVIK